MALTIQMNNYMSAKLSEPVIRILTNNASQSLMREFSVVYAPLRYLSLIWLSEKTRFSIVATLNYVLV